MGWVRGARPFHNWEKGNVKAEAGKGHWETGSFSVRFKERELWKSLFPEMCQYPDLP